MAQPTAHELVRQRQAQIARLLQIVEVETNRRHSGPNARWDDAGDLQRVVDGLTECVRVLTGAEL
jgi:hypothetical protein